MIKLFIADIKLLFRNKQQLFWSLMFPLIFTVIFGFFFGSDTTSAGTVALINNANTPVASSLESVMNSAKVFKVQKETNIDDAKKLLKNSKVVAVVVIPADFGAQSVSASKNLQLISDPGNAQSNSIVSGFLNQFLTTLNFQSQGIKPIYGIDQQNTSTNTFNYFDFVLVGLIGMALMNSSVQGVAISMAQYRDDQILKRVTTTPLPSWKFIIAQVLSRLIVNVIQVGLILGIGVYAFNGHIYGNLGMIFALAMLGGILFQLLGFTVASLTKTTQAAEGMATAVTIPMMFLAGVFFPIDSLPKWLNSIVQYLPLAPLLRMIRTAGLEAVSPFENPINIVIVCGWIVILLAISSLKFKMNPE
ncbi:MAG: ABC transporter permease [Patescibacteria group bacterium]|jgi:ABC-2 type transport system permease protein